MSPIATVQARMAELRALVEPAQTATTTTTTTTSTGGSTAVSFADTLAALGLDDTTLAGITGTASVAADGSSATGQGLVDSAMKYLGVPYVWGGESLAEGGLDCSGLVQLALADLGVTDGIPRVARDQMTLGTEVPSLAQALPGDLVVFNGGTHIGIYVGDGKMIDAPKPGKQVSVRDVYETPTTIRRILPQEQDASPVSSVVSSAAAQRAALELLAGSSTSGSVSAGSLGTAALAAYAGLSVAS